MASQPSTITVCRPIRTFSTRLLRPVPTARAGLDRGSAVRELACGTRMARPLASPDAEDRSASTWGSSSEAGPSARSKTRRARTPDRGRRSTGPASCGLPPGRLETASRPPRSRGQDPWHLSARCVFGHCNPLIACDSRGSIPPGAPTDCNLRWHRMRQSFGASA